LPFSVTEHLLLMY